MLKFRDLQLSDKELVERYFTTENYYVCDYCFVDIYMWSRHHKVRLCESDGYLFVYSEDEGVEYFLAPRSVEDKPIKPAIEALREYTAAREQELILMAVPAALKDKIEAEMPESFEFTEGRDNEDYIYTSESLAYLKGKKLHSKRNHINKFMAEHEGKWSFELINDDNIREFFRFQLDWCDLNDEFIGELEGSAAALKNYKELGLRGGILRLEGKIIAVTFGSRMMDMLIVHVEKADPDIQGAYQMINQQFVQACGQDVKYIDREEDLGLEGLRKAKLSYYPEFLGECYKGVYKG
jgi:hypothetical protein